MASSNHGAQAARHTAGVLPGDDVVPDANMLSEHEATFAAAPDAVWPWLVQLGKGRAGWYLPSALERRVVPRARRAATAVDPRWQGLVVGDEVPDYGGRDETLEVVAIDPPRALVYRAERKGTVFSWALVLESLPGGRTRLRHRFRARLKSAGWHRRAIVLGGGAFDRATIALMVAGLRERVEAPGSALEAPTSRA
jgi:hypothetical protein